MKKKILASCLMTLTIIAVSSCRKSDKSLKSFESNFKENMKDVASVNSTVSISDNDTLVYEQTKSIYVMDRDETDCAGDITITTNSLGDTFELEESIESTSFAAVSMDTLFSVSLKSISNYKIEENVISATLSKEQYKKVFDLELDCSGNVNVSFTNDDNRIKEFNSTYKTSTNKDVSIKVKYYYVHNYSDKKLNVTFALEGGKCKESTKNLLHTYNQPNVLILDPNSDTFGSDNVTKLGYRIEGWYQDKKVEGDKVTYSNRWDFDKMRLVEDVTLYARWVPITTYSYEMFFKNSAGELVSAGKYNVSEGQVFKDNFKYASKITGYTALPGFYQDEDCNTPWNTEYKHPGGESNLTINVYFKVIEGEYALVSTADELKAAASANKNIYLISDIDFDEAYGDKEKKKTLTFDDYTGVFIGNGHTISNFNIVPQKSTGKASLNNDDAKLNLNDNESNDAMYYAIFKSLDGATIKDVNFKGVKMNFYASTPDKITNIFAANLAVTAKDSKISNVSIEASYTIDSRTKPVWTCFYKNENIYKDLGNNTFENVTTNVTYTDNRNKGE